MRQVMSRIAVSATAFALVVGAGLAPAGAAPVRPRNGFSGLTLTAFAGTGAPGAPQPGPAQQSPLGFMFGVAADGDGNVYIADRTNHRI